MTHVQGLLIGGDGTFPGSWHLFLAGGHPARRRQWTKFELEKCAVQRSILSMSPNLHCKPFHKTKKELIFNVAFTAIAGLTVLLTNYKEEHTLAIRGCKHMEYIYLGDRLTDPVLNGKRCKAARRTDGNCAKSKLNLIY